jgi:Flp pilus assembly protein TadB
MAQDDGKPGDETLSAAFEQLKHDGASWLSAEQKLLRARFRDGMRRVELAAILATSALIAALAATFALANMLILLLTPSIGAVLASLLVAIILFIAGALLILWVKSLLSPKHLGERAKTHAKVIWNALNEPN